MRKADHYGSMRRAKRQKNRLTNAKRCEDFISKIVVYRTKNKFRCRFVTNEEIARRIGLNIETCKALGVFEKMIKRMPKRTEEVRREPTPIFAYPMGHEFTPFDRSTPAVSREFINPFHATMPLLLLAGAVRRNSRK